MGALVASVWRGICQKAFVVCIVIVAVASVEKTRHSAEALQSGLRQDLETQGFRLIEIGDFSRIRMVRLTDGLFRQRLIEEHSVVDGVSRDGRWLLVSAYSGRHPSALNATDEIDVAAADGTTVKAFQPDVRGLTAIFAELSPDWHKVAFVGIFGGAKSHGLQVVDGADNISTLVATTEADMPRSIGWSSDGSELVYDMAGEVWLYHFSTGRSTLLATGDTPAWSPDGSWIAYRRADLTACLVRPDGSQSRTILNGVRIADGLRWSPDSRYILFTDRNSGTVQVVNVADGRTETIMKPLDGKTEARLRWVKDFPI